MSFERQQLAFWLATFAVVAVLLWLLSEILLPLVAGLAIAYLVNALTNRLELLGVAVPVAAAIGVLLRFALPQYRASPFCTGGIQS